MGVFCRHLRLLALGLVFAISAHAQDPWQGQNIYQIVTDRFFNGDVSNDNADGNYSAAAGQAVHGGDFKGIEQKLDYIKALGATAIWISPVVLNGNGDYHGYAGRDFYNVDPHFGSLADLKHLIDAAHAKGLLVIDDVVVNHGGQLLNSNDSGYPNFRSSPPYNLFYRDNSKQYAAPFDPGSGQSLASLFHTNGFIQDFNNATQVENGSLQGLDDFRTENSYVQTNMASIYTFWIDQGFDGFRIDTVKHVDVSFWQNWCPQIHQHAADIGKPDFFMFGEVYDSSETKNASYTGTTSGGNFKLDSVLDYPLYFLINPVFSLANSNTKQIEDHYHAVDANYDPSAQMRLVTFLDNHDQSRFLNSANANNNMQRLNLALAFLYTARGIPCLYYGTEQGFNGGADPNNREDMFAGQFEQGPSLGDNFNETHPIFQLVGQLNNFRRLYPALRNGLHANLWNNPNSPGLFAYARRLNNQEVFVVLNAAAIAQALPSRPTIYTPGTVLVNLLNPSETSVVTSASELPALNVPPTTAKIFIAQSQMLALDPVVSSITPSHDAQNMQTLSKIVIQFSKPMDTASVESAFSTFPSTTGTFTWSANHDQLTYEATGGLPELSTIFIHISDTAADSTAKHLYASFDSRFSTTQKTITDVTPPAIAITDPQPGARFTDTFTNTNRIGGTASDDQGVTRIEIKLDGGDWAPVFFGSPAKSVNWGKSILTNYFLNGPHVISARATDAAGNVSAVASIPLVFDTIPFKYYEQRLFAYGSQGRGLQGCPPRSGGVPESWSSDQPYVPNLDFNSYGFIGGIVARSTNTITNVCSDEQELYQLERYSATNDTFRYVFNCPAGVYEVEILEAETFMNGPNQRRFDIYAQGQKVLPNFDIFVAAGGANLALRRTFTASVANAVLSVDFRPVYDNARVSAIHVKKIADQYSDNDGIADWWRLAHFGHATGLSEDQSRAGDDSDGDGKTNLEEFLANTDPLDRNSFLRISKIEKAGNDIQISCYGGLTRVNQLQRSDSLAAPNWINVGSPFQFSAQFPGPAVISDSGAVGLPSPQFYRVLVLTTR